MWYAFGSLGIGAGLLFIDWHYAMPFIGLGASLMLATLIFFKPPSPPRVPPGADA